MPAGSGFYLDKQSQMGYTLLAVLRSIQAGALVVFSPLAVFGTVFYAFGFFVHAVTT